MYNEALFVIKTDSLDKAKEVIEKILSIEFEPHESSFMGGLYYFFKKGSCEIKLFHNADIFDGEPIDDGCETGCIALKLDSKEPLTEFTDLLRKSDLVIDCRIGEEKGTL